jgi:hypothetical protein
MLYHVTSPTLHARTPKAHAVLKERWPVAVNTPMANRIGTAGKGAPKTSAATQPKRNM